MSTDYPHLHLCNACESEKGSTIFCRCGYKCPKHLKEAVTKSVVTHNKIDYYSKVDSLDGRKETLKKITESLVKK